MNKKALITGITGQDGSYLAEFLLQKGYEVHGTIRRASTFNTDRIDHLIFDQHVKNRPKLYLHHADLTDGSRLTTLMNKIQPDEVYHLAAQSHVRVSFDAASADTYHQIRVNGQWDQLLENVRWLRKQIDQVAPKCELLQCFLYWKN